MKNRNDVQERDIFSEGFEDEAGGIVPDERMSENLPGEAREMTDGEKEEKRQEIMRFVRQFPGVRPGDVPDEVWMRVHQGESLTDAYSRYEMDRLRRENEALRTERDKRERRRELGRRSAGSQTGVGGGERDPFDDGWDWDV